MKLFISETTAEELVSTFQIKVKEVIQEEVNKFKPQQKQELKFYTRKEVCKLLGISLVTLSSYIDKGVISCNRIGKNIRFTDKHITDALIDINNKKTA
ncbi:hypothetical protein UJ101_01011 [Flavobacteriaceae bacterium UJ101]|nr:hypothetical protein UJ101_01011 [Flavobacteriaceae bacterium UJ101]